MKLGIISDVHIDEQHSELEFEGVFAECIQESGAEAILIAGDFSEYYLRTLSFIERLQKRVDAKIYYCFGNHDLWSKHEITTDVQGILGYVHGSGRDKGFVQNAAVELSEDVVLVAGVGWYDYSFAFPGKFTEEELERRSYMGRTWRDSQYCAQGASDKAVEKAWTGELLSLVDSYPDKKVVFMTHMVNHPAFLVDEAHPKYEMFQYFNAFMGSEGLYNITKRENVKVAVSGHVHYRKSFEENGTYYMCRCLGYESEYPAFGGVQELKAQIEDAMEVVEL